MQFQGRVIRKEPSWYRKNYHRPAPIPVTLAGDVIQRFWLEQEPEWLFDCDIEEALHFLQYSLRQAQGEQEGEYLQGFKGHFPELQRENLFYVKWKKYEFYQEMARHPIGIEDLEHLMQAGLTFGYSPQAGGEASSNFRSGHPHIDFFIVDNRAEYRFSNSPEHRHTLVHELIHLVYRAPNVLIERCPGMPNTETDIDEVINYEAQRICLHDKELVDYALKELNLIGGE